MTPEQIAADRIAQTVASHLCVMPGGTRPERSACEGCAHDAQRAGKASVEAISAAGLLIVPADRIAELLDALYREAERRTAAFRALRLCLPHMVESVESIVSGHSLAFDWRSGQPLPAECEPEAVLMAADAEAAIAAAKAALGATADA
jgi:hypothetical protein